MKFISESSQAEPMKELLNYLRQNASLSDSHIRKLNIKKNQILTSNQNSPEHTIFLIQEGIAFFEVYYQDKPHITSFYSDWTLFHAEPILKQAFTFEIKLPYRVRAATEMVVYEINRDFLIDHLYVQPKFFHFLAELGLASLSFSTFMTAINKLPANETLAIHLQILATYIGEKHGTAYHLPSAISQSVLASLCNCAQSSISGHLHFLVKEGILESSSKPFIIKDMDALASCYDSSISISSMH
ncbi:Crp/Fnr family transcriptional regulator [Listeria fleischmannii]|jgi:CRP-like cAMP-binding protein|uniref:Crp/Fnr family transcriptional regulator n=1 Tax=Listeria fleischmannii TaxID=1069827 RepID=UPI00162A6ED2|nr:Crp/Fnr family transcriptional regulator [Listeria fleischmannii]MBC1417673.1 Crp/Fnr family transcriptional regulator [Listeria fleischmannii]